MRTGSMVCQQTLPLWFGPKSEVRSDFRLAFATCKNNVPTLIFPDRMCVNFTLRVLSLRSTGRNRVICCVTQSEGTQLCCPKSELGAGKSVETAFGHTKSGEGGKIC